MQFHLTAPRKTRVKPRMNKFHRPLNVFACELLQWTFGHYPWDDWEKEALDAGVPEDLASLGRLTVREAYQHDWDDDLRSLCGWYDQGRRMIKLALGSPKEARRQWNILLRTDGLRGDYPPTPRLRWAGPPRSTEWTWGYLRRDAQRFCQTLFGS